VILVNNIQRIQQSCRRNGCGG